GSAVDGRRHASGGRCIRARVERSIAEGQFWNRRPDWLAAITGPALTADLPPAQDGDAGTRDGDTATRGGDTATRPQARGTDQRWTMAVGLAIAGLIMLIFVASNPNRHNFYEHFTWQAAAWLEG